ncbi:MAG: phosphatase PAP2 family protein [Desulfobulbaceae bacterium]|nr:phosphatase PAP2 family protein [Desulfobulbaceae bacterium]
MIKKEYTWRVSQLFICQLSAILLYASWLGGPFRGVWDRLDNAVFYFLNGSLQDGRSWQFFWAVANNRLFDLVPAMCMLGVFFHFLFAGNIEGVQRREGLQRRVAVGIFMVVYSGLTTVALSEIFCSIDRLSPTLVLEHSIRLSELFPDIPLKDASSVSFPGDHATILFLFAAFMWYYGGIQYGLAGLLLSVVFSLPRLVGGGHWLTDDVVGGGFIFLTAVGWALFTPLHGVTINFLENGLARIRERFQRWRRN